MCTGYAHMRPGPRPTMSPKQFEFFAKLFPPSGLPPDERVVPMVLNFLKHAHVAGLPEVSEIKNVSLVVHDLSNAGTGMAFSEFSASDALLIRTTSTAQYATAVFHNRVLLAVRPLPRTDLIKPYAFAREMAAYMLLNDLLASDATIPRAGCVVAFKDQMRSMPGIQHELISSILAVPANDVNSRELALTAYQVFSGSKEATKNKLTIETLGLLGSSPDITFVYRDADTTLGFGPEFDVIRLSHRAVRTYAMLFMMKD